MRPLERARQVLPDAQNVRFADGFRPDLPDSWLHQSAIRHFGPPVSSLAEGGRVKSPSFHGSVIDWEYCAYSEATTELANVPICSISTSTRSPGPRNRGGWRATPTPEGVPVNRRSPTSRVQTDEM